VVTMLAHGCPLHAIVAALGFDERTVADWWARSGRQGQDVQEHLVEQPCDLGHVQADELRVKKQGGIVWMAMAMMVKTRLWLGGEVSVTLQAAGCSSSGRTARHSHRLSRRWHASRPDGVTAAVWKGPKGGGSRCGRRRRRAAGDAQSCGGGRRGRGEGLVGARRVARTSRSASKIFSRVGGSTQISVRRLTLSAASARM
jgi:hypothetical protein